MRKILLGVSSSIAAVKVPELIQLFTRAGFELQVVMTEAATQLISPLALQAFTKNPVRSALFDAQHEAAMGHIELARFADTILIAPASADFIAKLAHGFADDLLSTLCLASSAPLVIAPAMNPAMWSHPATQANVKTLAERGACFLGPDFGEMACGDIGLGRLLAPSTIVAHFTHQPLAQKTVLITAGPTQEALDPVRYLTNHSSGKMGVALAESALNLGAKVILVAGPLKVSPPPQAQLISVTSAEEMLAAVEQHIPQTDLFIAAAAVADYRVKTPAAHKIKKNQAEMTVTLVKNPDILHTVSHSSNRPICIGFAAETDNLWVSAMEKLTQKNLDGIIANEVGEGVGFHQDENACTLIFNSNEYTTFERMPKRLLACEIMRRLAERFYA